MKKLLAISSLVLGLCSNALAYQNDANGFSVKEGTPMIVLESADSLAYSNYSAKSHDAVLDNKILETYTIIHTTSKKDMSKVLGQPFSTAFFDKEVNKLVLDKGKTDPKKITKLAEYKTYEDEDKELLKVFNVVKQEEMSAVEENNKVSVVKAGKGKAIEFTNYYAVNGNSIALKTTVLSDNDMIYTVSTIGPKLNTIENKDKKDKVIKVMPLNETDFEANIIKKFKADNAKTIKSFKTFMPTTKKHIFGYEDAITKKFIELPQEWFYIKGNFVETFGNGHVCVAANADEIRNAVKDIADYRTQKDNKNDNLTNKEYEDYLNITLKNINGLKIAASAKLSDNELNGMFGNPLQTKLVADQILRETFRRAKDFSTPYFRLDDYDYNTWFNESSGKINFEILATLCKTFVYRGDFKSEYQSKTNGGFFSFDVKKVKTNSGESSGANTEPAKLTLKNTSLK